MSTLRKTVIALVVSFLVVAVIVIISLMDGLQETNESVEPNTLNEQQNIEEESEEPDILSDVNPEEKNPVTKTAQLPFENEEYAITYRFNKPSPHGVVVVVIDKTNANSTSSSVREKALSYLRNHGVPTATIDIEFKGIEDVR